MEHCGQSTEKKCWVEKPVKKNPFLWGGENEYYQDNTIVLGAQVLVCKVLKACLTNNSM